MDRGDDQSSRNDGALVIVSLRWNANFWLFYTLFYTCALSFKELNETHFIYIYLYIYLYPMSLTSMTGSCRLLCYRTPVEVE